jgi:hypothetical protein
LERENVWEFMQREIPQEPVYGTEFWAHRKRI